MNDLTMWGRMMRGGLSIGLLLLAACTSPLDETSIRTGQSALESRAPSEVTTQVIPWGHHEQQVGLQPEAAERRATGVSAVALGPGGELYLLDRLKGRVVQVRGRELRTSARVAVTAEGLSVGPAGTLAVYSPLGSTVLLFAGGINTGETAIPRILHQIQGVTLGPSRQVSVHNAYQETLTLGPPSLPQTLETILHSRRRGAAFLPDGTGVIAGLTPEGSPELILLSPREETPAMARFTLGESALAARVIGAAGYTVCLRLERAAPGDEFTVLRSVTCLDARSGERLLHKELARPGLFLPRQELALGGSPPRLAFIRPELEGLRITLWALRPATEGRAK